MNKQEWTKYKEQVLSDEQNKFTGYIKFIIELPQAIKNDYVVQYYNKEEMINTIKWIEDKELYKSINLKCINYGSYRCDDIAINLDDLTCSKCHAEVMAKKELEKKKQLLQDYKDKVMLLWHSKKRTYTFSINGLLVLLKANIEFEYIENQIINRHTLDLYNFKEEKLCTIINVTDEKNNKIFGIKEFYKVKGLYAKDREFISNWMTNNNEILEHLTDFELPVTNNIISYEDEEEKE